MVAGKHSHERAVIAQQVTKDHYADIDNVGGYVESVQRKDNIGTLVAFGVNNGIIFDNGVVVEAGCGPGLHLASLVKVGVRQIVAVDLSPAMVKAAQERAEQLGIPCTVDVVDITQLNAIPAEAGAATVVYSNAVLLHFEGEQFKAALREFHRVLKDDDGMLVLRLLLDCPAAERAERQIGRPDIHESGKYFHLYTPEEVKSLLLETGFNPVIIEGDTDLGGSWGRVIAKKLVVSPEC